jgi:ribonuclease J
MLKTHAKIANEIGCPIENTFVIGNGDVLKINRKGATIEGKVKAGEAYIEGTRIGDFSSEVIRERKLLSNEGLFTIIFTIDMKNKTIPVEPQVVSRGFIYMKDSGDLTKQLTNAAKTFLANELKQTKLINLYQLQKSVTEYMTKIIVEETDRKPMVIPVFMQLNE